MTSGQWRQTAIRRFSRRAPDPDVLEALLEGACFVPGSFDDPNTYAQLRQALAGIDSDAGGPLNRVLYLSTAPLFFPLIVERLGEHGLNRRPDADVRIVIEKPFGTTLAEARAAQPRACWRCSTSRRCSGSTTTSARRRSRTCSRSASRTRCSSRPGTATRSRSVQITAAEDVGVEGRAGYYDQAGALRDLVQNHLLQLLCHVAMEPPVDFSADEVRNEKVKVLRAIHPPAEDEVDAIAVRAQYGPGVVGGEPVPGYLEEPGVPPDSTTETYAALRLEIESWRWAGVPFYLRTGKRLARKLTEIAMQLRPVPHLGFAAGRLASASQPNQLIMTIQPDEGVSLSLAAKIPGTRMRIRPVLMQFLYGSSFLSESPEAYERLILDVMRGDATLFTRNDEVEAQWRICDPIVHAWARKGGPLPQYPAGSQGPAGGRSDPAPGRRLAAHLSRLPRPRAGLSPSRDDQRTSLSRDGRGRAS